MIDNTTVPTPKVITTVVIPPTELPPTANQTVPPEAPIWLIRLLKGIFPVAALLFIALIAVPGFLQKWLWMRQLDYSSIFWTLFSVKVELIAAAFVFAVVFLWLNVRWAGMGSGAKATAVSRHIATRSGGHHRVGCGIVCERPVYSMGYLSTLSLWRFLRTGGPGLWCGSGILRVPPPLV